MRKSLMLLSVTAFCGCAASRPLPDPCSLLTAADVQKVQGSALVGASPSTQKQGNVTVSQCFYRTEEGARSVTLELTSAGSAHATRELWEQQFEPGHEREREREEREREGERDSGAERHGVEVPGIGEDAVWTGNRVSGVLYVRTSGAILRVSVGGAGKQEEKLEKTKELARAAVGRMR